MEIKKITQQYWIDLYIDQDYSQITKIFPLTHIAHINDSGPLELSRDFHAENVKRWHEVIDKPEFSIADIISEGSLVMARWTLNGIHKGGMFDIIEYGQEVSTWGMSSHKIIDNKIIELWGVWDQHGLIQQLKSSK
jgi:predicted ester cyclase